MPLDPDCEDITEALNASIAFAKPADVHADQQRPGMLRSVSHPMDADINTLFDLQRCLIRDWSAASAPDLNLETMGFDAIDLSGLGRVQSVLDGVRQAGHITADDASTLRRQLNGRSFTLSGGKQLRLLFIAPEGLIMRKAGPNGRKADPDVSMTQMNGHDGAINVHGDQDVRGTPMRQIFRGAAPWIFRHQSPDGANKRSPFFLVNIWIPLEQITRPLTLMDRSSLDNRRHQVCYALPTEGFLDRDEDRRVNDIWTFLHDEGQRWYFNAQMNPGRAYVFDTLGTPHGSVILPGEDVIEHYYLCLQAACDAELPADVDKLQAVLNKPAPSMPDVTTAPLRRTIKEMQALLKEVELNSDVALQSDWRKRAAQATDSVVRKSIEMRAVAMLVPDMWPFNR